MLKQWIAGVLSAVGLVLALPGLAETRQISPIEAGHVAEIHTGRAVTGIERLTLGARQVYEIDTAGRGIQFRVRVDAIYGRLLSIKRVVPKPAQDIYQWPGIRVVAHRGGALLGPPENTLPAIEKAIEIGADLIEIDIRQTADEQLVLMHDATVDRTTNGSGEVRKLKLRDIRRLEITHRGPRVIRVPTLREALEVMKGRIDPDLDFKEGDLKKLVAVVRAVGVESNATFHGSWSRCGEVVGLAPRIRIRPTVEYPDQVPDAIQKLRPAIVNLDWHAVSEKAIRLAHLGGCHAFVNCLSTADTDFYVRWAIDIGADYIQSDRPDRVIQIMKTLGLRSGRIAPGDPLGTPLRSPRLRYPLR